MKSTDVANRKLVITIVNNDPKTDGKDHINIDFNGRTKLGRMLSQFAHVPFTHPIYGPFNCMEGFWWWLKSAKKPKELRSLIGPAAKSLGKPLPSAKPPNFRREIFIANYYKIDSCPQLRELLVKSTLPFASYYLHGPTKLVIEASDSDWMLTMFEELRQMFKEGRKLDEDELS